MYIYKLELTSRPVALILVFQTGKCHSPCNLRRRHLSHHHLLLRGDRD
ncbi:hypothetical protein SLEP1_g46031 [Rubroshorea leprosula]|uniref:Uncharacterized protein n=1 Tax=Rubroshorea leprosula TaxID=152421 RepID=A0AAV5LLN5_9ROSI|nr:hypothetical protein SLEP1_g46031 [Rubroshorea leprosula]